MQNVASVVRRDKLDCCVSCARFLDVTNFTRQRVTKKAKGDGQMKGEKMATIGGNVKMSFNRETYGEIPELVHSACVALRRKWMSKSSMALT